MLHSGLTAKIGLDKLGQIKEDDKVAITAAAGGVGQMAVQWAKYQGCFVVAITSSPEKVDDKVAITATDAGVGQMAVQWAKTSGVFCGCDHFIACKSRLLAKFGI